MNRLFFRIVAPLVSSSLTVAACGGEQGGGSENGSGGAAMGQSGGAESGDAGGGPPDGSGGSPAGGGLASGAAPGAGGTLSSGAGSGAGGERPVVDPPAGANWHGWICPPGPFAALPFVSTVTVEQVEGLPPDDEYVMAERSLIIVEGPVWIDGALYVSQIDGGAVGGGFPGGEGSGGEGSGGEGSGGEGSGGGSSMSGGDPPPARVIRMSQTGEVSVVLPEAGSNGLAVDPEGALTLAVHTKGAIESLDWEALQTMPLVGSYAEERFNSPNDLAFGPDGSLYFTDPDYQAPRPRPQEQTRVYRLAPGASEAEVLIEGRRQPNGVSISPGGRTLYVSGEDGIFSYPIADDGSIGEGAAFAAGVASRSDGMGIDCAGNVYLTVGGELVVVSPAGVELVRVSIPGVQSVTNVAFGGPERTTVYLTSLGTTPNSVAGVFRLSAALPGYPY